MSNWNISQFPVPSSQSPIPITPYPQRGPRVPQSPIPITPYPQRGPRVPQSPVHSQPSTVNNQQSPKEKVCDRLVGLRFYKGDSRGGECSKGL